jgi:GntR family transcriptional regulator
MVARVPDVAVYRQIAADLRERITSGDLTPGLRLPSEVALAHTYSVGIGTIRRVMTMLRLEGLVVGEQGQVARVAEQPENVTVRVPASLAPTIRSRRPTVAEQERLGIPPGIWVVEVSHGGFVDLYAADRTEILIVEG